jgi:mannose-1-phosphate guanylyltransferase
MSEVFGLVMAGGGGTRLWPLSRLDRPKQVLHLLGNRSLFQMALDRLQPWLSPEHILVATPPDLLRDLRSQAPELPEASFLVEPSPKGTAAVIGLAALRLSQTRPDGLMVCLTADHHIGNAERLRHLLLAACEVADAGALVTLGIPPTYADTGYGYIEQGDSIGVFRGFEAHRVRAFREKPDRAVAEAYLKDGRHAWNSGMFVWRVDRILDAIERFMPNLAGALDRIRPSLGSADEASVLAQEWHDIQRETIDIGVMERADNVVVLAATDLMWADIGSWDRLYELRHPDAEGNVLDATVSLAVDSRGTLVVSRGREQGGRPKLVALLGVEDLVIIDTGDVLLVCPRRRAPHVRELVERLQASGLDTYMVWES